ncbi:MGMT family protein [Streptomyces sp. H39-S7]|uniref:MGMT family protein n=1 Tax=Streptomyces sp. H39-S7 TaxID=3004357 RepID=UPI0022AE6096|nr:MGMT family protein [Streptomyces sp. H39-S7]MCZ4124634.1 MGMT family protein [Streptomyces sp. H39-S7]
MSRHDNAGPEPGDHSLEGALAGLASPGPVDLALGILRHVGISPERYDAYVLLDTDAGGLYAAYSPTAITGSVLESMVVSPEMFEETHWQRTGRTAVRSTLPFPGLRPALRTGRAKSLPVDLTGLDAQERAVLQAVRAVPKGQLRPVGWIAREADVTDMADLTGFVARTLARNPLTLLIPCHRVTYEDGTPCDAAYTPATGRALRSAEGIDMLRLAELSRRGGLLLGSDTTHIYCHPTCAHARRITPPHQRPFRTADEARGAGYRACRSCRPVSV